jgi:hypothetical protein
VSADPATVGNPYLEWLDIEEVMEPEPASKRQLVAFTKWASGAGGSQTSPHVGVTVTAEDQRAYDEIFEPYGGAASRAALGLE